MKIAIYSHSIAPSIDGVCRRFSGILWELVKQNHQLILFTLEDSPQDLPEMMERVTLPHMIMPSYPGKKVARPSISAFYRVWKTLQKHRPEVLHVTADGFSTLFALAGLMLRIPVVGSFHTDLLDLLSTHNAHPFQKWCVVTKERVDSLVLDSCATTSESFKTKLAKQGLECQHVILTGVNTEMFSATKRNNALRHDMMFGDPNGFLCVYVGRISREKRIDVIVDAVRAIPGAYLAVVGDGPSAAVYSAMHGKEQRLYCRPRFLTHSELAEVYASSDLHVSASEFETLGNTVLEAFSCRIPVVVPRSQGFCDTVKDCENGFLFEPKNSADAQQLILRVRNDPALRRRMGEAGHAAVSARSIERVVSDLLDWYRRSFQRHTERRNSAGTYHLSLFLLVLVVPFGILALGCYDLLMFSLLCVVGYSPAEKSEQQIEKPATHTLQSQRNSRTKSGEKEE